MSAFKKFDPYKFIEEVVTPPKVPKAPKAEATLGILGGLGGRAPRIFTKPLAPWTDDIEERAAIIEYDGGIGRDWAEALTRFDFQAPPEVPTDRWQLFLNDCARFLDGGWAYRAHALGWTPRDLFGCYRHSASAEISLDGMLWTIAGGRLVALSANTVVVETANGVRTTYRRSPTRSGVTLSWDPVSGEAGPSEKKGTTP
jgi:hypothetical protein